MDSWMLEQNQKFLEPRFQESLINNIDFHLAAAMQRVKPKLLRIYGKYTHLP